jgi:hypothetical protein
LYPEISAFGTIFDCNQYCHLIIFPLPARRPMVFPRNKGGAGSLCLPFKGGKNHLFLGCLGDLKKHKEEINE